MSGIDINAIATMTLNGHDKLQPKTDFPCIALPSNYNLNDLEKFQTLRNVFRGTFETSRIADFESYCKSASDSPVTCFVNPEGMSAEMIFDLGTTATPQHCKHKAVLKLEKTTAYKTGVLNSITQEFSQQQLFNFIQDWKNYIEVHDQNGDVIQTSIACQRILKIDIKKSMESSHEVSDYSNSSSALAKIEAQSKEGHSMPKGILFTCKPYDSLKEYNFFLRMSLGTNRSDKPYLALRCEGLDDLNNQMREEFSEKLKEAFGANVLLGTFTTD